MMKKAKIFNPLIVDLVPSIVLRNGNKINMYLRDKMTFKVQLFKEFICCDNYSEGYPLKIEDREMHFVTLIFRNKKDVVLIPIYRWMNLPEIDIREFWDSIDDLNNGLFTQNKNKFHNVNKMLIKFNPFLLDPEIL